MDLESIRKKTGLDRRGFVRHLTPYLKGFALDEFMLTRMESGESFQEDRMEAIFLATKQAFPEHTVDDVILEKKSRKWRSLKISGFFLGSTFLAIFLIGMATFYLFFPESAYLKNLDRLLAAIGTSVTVIGFFVGLYFQKNG